MNYCPAKLRLSVYLKFIDDYKVVDSMEHQNYIGRVGKDDESRSLYIKERIEKDKKLTREIFKNCKKYGVDNEEEVFNIYKKLGKMYAVDYSTLHVIFCLFKLPGADKNSVYTILDYTYNILELNMIFQGKDNEDSISFVEKNVDREQHFDSDTLEESIRKNQTGFASNSNLFSPKVQKEESSAKKMKTEECEPFTQEKLKQLMKLIMDYDFDTFLVMVDIGMALNLTFMEIIKQASQFSTITSLDALVKVIGSRQNTRYYHAGTFKPKEKQEKHDLNYFDFLVIQNETIKAQENIKDQYEKELAELKHELSKYR
ncbi:hypothetical protein ECANGB1_1484 [Enterospora canceri]|uniref:Uncharacterized protein n=1 Tax=Enterospora canceri TaxID=1081671 RepID=A0A1Y1S610_9MICR|nr:hypothetical protein ECANGB1_1484 [Enterospora canceri]